MGRQNTHRPKKKEIVHNETQKSASENRNRGRIKPDLTEVVYPEGYIQNAEQSSESIWQKIRNNDK